MAKSVRRSSRCILLPVAPRPLLQPPCPFRYPPSLLSVRVFSTGYRIRSFHLFMCIYTFSLSQIPPPPRGPLRPPPPPPTTHRRVTLFAPLSFILSSLSVLFRTLRHPLPSPPTPRRPNVGLSSPLSASPFFYLNDSRVSRL